MLLKHYLDQGVSRAELARRFGVTAGRSISGSRRANWSGIWGRCKSVYAASRGGPQAGSVQGDHRRESRGVRPAVAKRLFDEVRAAGYPCCYESVRNYVRVVRPQEPIEPVVCFETPDARARWTSGRSRFPGAGVMPQWWFLGYSRLLWLRFYPRQTMAGPDASAGERLRAFRRGSRGAAVRPDARGGAVRRSRRRWLPGAERGVPTFRPRTGGSCPARAGPIGHARRARWNARFATSATASSTVARS